MSDRVRYIDSASAARRAFARAQERPLARALARHDDARTLAAHNGGGA
jgi:hypothetical protein